ncbi:hypothetical protein [Glutamicibacter arilaitensis]|uniref:Uncharacterized protein n=1 Tax=Glutamicibacter arilaitensis TaxID=256701 RepID=A0A4Y8TWT8_9MICC|nr:hypothetical protein [Glutamicibacter arilaitensis]TFH56660.1 hypothetical protein EXY26_06415 [Glutamicibacter arilaitensis]
MRRLSKTTWRRIAVYLGVSIAGLALFIAAYCLISGRTLIEALDSFWIALAIALATAATSAVRDQRKDAQTEGGEQEL